MTHYSLSDFNALVKKTLADSLEPSYWIVAEIGEINVNRNGHCYLDLIEKDNQQIKSKIRGTIWSYSFVSISRAFSSQTGAELQSGMKILLNATLEFHEVYGLSLNVRDIDPTFTLGEREKQRQETIQRLEEDGIIDLNKSLNIPKIPQRVAVISSETAAGYGDFKTQLYQNKYGYQIDVQLFNATMQGDSASSSIIAALHIINNKEEQFDIVVLIRGGGAKTDLDCFDDYELCAHLAQFPLPIITGIGHERDSTLADMVACVNLKTPTAVAEFILSAFMQFENDLLLAFESVNQNAQQILKYHNDILNQVETRISMYAGQIIQKECYQIDRYKAVFENRPFEIIKNERKTIQLIDQLIQSQDPNRILKKGFTLTKVEGQYITAKMKIKKGDSIETITSSQTIKSKAE